MKLYPAKLDLANAEIHTDRLILLILNMLIYFPALGLPKFIISVVTNNLARVTHHTRCNEIISP